MKGLKLLLLSLFIYSISFAQTTPWTGTPGVTWQYRTYSGEKQIRALFGNSLISFMDSLHRYTTKAQFQLAKDSLVNLYTAQTVGGNKTFTGQVRYNSYAEFSGQVVFTTGGGANGAKFTNGTPVSFFNADNTSQYLITNDAVNAPDITAGLTIRNFTGMGSVNIIGDNIKDSQGKFFLKTGSAPDSTTIANSYLSKTNNLSDLSNKATARTNLGVDSVLKRYQTNGFTVYNSGYWSNLSDFTTNGFTPTITATNTIQFTGGTADTTKYITVNGAVNTDENINFEVIYVPATTTGYGLRIGKRSVNTPVPNSGSIGYDVQNNTLNIYGSLGDNLLSTITNSFKVAAGDLLSLKYVQRGSTITATLTDFTQNYASLTLVNTNVNINSSAMVVYNWGNTNEIKQIKITSNSNRSPKLIVQGDSKQLQPTYYQKYPNYLGSLGVIDIFSGTGDRAGDALADLPYIIKYVKPEYVLLNIGRNDLNYGTPTATWQANYASIVSQYTAAGIKVVNLLPIPETVVADQSILYNYIAANYSQRIDVAPVWSNALDLAADNIHPNEAGARLIASTILASNLIPKNPNLQVEQITDVQSYSAKTNSQNDFRQNQLILGLELGARSSFLTSSNGGVYNTQTGGTANFPNNNSVVIQSRGNSNADIYQVTGSTPSIKTRLYGATGDYQIGGATTTDAGYTLDVQGTQRVTGNSLFKGILNLDVTAGNNAWQTSGNGSIWVGASGGTAPFTVNGNNYYQSRVSAGFGHYFGTGATAATRFAILDASNISYNNLTPEATNTRTLGAVNLLWSNAYFTNYQVSLTGLLKGNGAGVNTSVAVAETDYTTPNTAGNIGNKVLRPTNTFQAATGTTADSLRFASSGKMVEKALAIQSGTGQTAVQTATTLTLGNDTTIIRTVQNSYSKAQVDANIVAAGRTRAFLNSNITLALNGDYLATTSTLFAGALPATTGFLTDGSKLIIVAATGTAGARVTVPSGYTLVGLSGAATPGTGGITLINGGKVQFAPVGTNSYQYYVLSGSVTVN